jgi:hypothetical protein
VLAVIRIDIKHFSKVGIVIFILLFCVTIIMSALSEESLTELCSDAKGNVSCPYCKTQADGQKLFDSDSIKYNRLDGDNDGEACESRP